jgi:hypothetical protein
MPLLAELGKFMILISTNMPALTGFKKNFAGRRILCTLRLSQFSLPARFFVSFGFCTPSRHAIVTRLSPE